MREQLVLLFIQVLAVAAVNANIGPIRLHFPFYIHEKDNFSSDNLEKGDVSGKFWLAMNYTYAVVNGNSTNISANKGYFDLRLTRFDVREGPPDDIFTSDLDRVWAKDKGWPVDLIMSFPDLDSSFTVPKTEKPVMRLRIPFTLPSAYISPIPKIVHSAYISKDVKKHSFETLPHSIQRSITSFKEHNPNYESRFIGSIEDMRNDILEFEGGTVLEAFDTLVPFAYKVDLWRLVMMYNIGGVYSDSKLILSEPLDLLLSSHIFSPDYPQSILVKDRWDFGIMNSFMAMPPGTQYARKGIDGIVKNVDKRAYHNNLLAITGPTFLQNQVYNHLERKDKSFFLFLSVTDDLFDFSNHVQTPGQNDDVKRTRAQRVVIYQNGEYRRHAKTTGSQSYNDKYYNCQVFGEPEPSKKCHEELENSATVITALHFTQFVIIAGTVICTYLFVG